MLKLKEELAEAMEDLPRAVERLKRSAASSEAVARETRARVRRQRINSQRSFNAIKPGDQVIEMPAQWRDDEPTTEMPVIKTK